MAPTVIVAHPDDEVLWFSGVLQSAARVVVAYAEHFDDKALTAARQRVRDASSVPIDFLPLRSAGVYKQSDWTKTRLTRYGVGLRRRCSPRRTWRYVRNFRRLVAALDECVRDSSEIFTHSPWGEYGHEEHIQVWRAVTKLAVRYGKDVWIWDDSAGAELIPRSRARLDHYNPLPSLDERELTIDLTVYRTMRLLYQREGAWTYDDDYEPPAPSVYLRAVREGQIELVPVVTKNHSRRYAKD